MRQRQQVLRNLAKTDQDQLYYTGRALQCILLHVGLAFFELLRCIRREVFAQSSFLIYDYLNEVLFLREY